MPRYASRGTRTARRRRQTKWCGVVTAAPVPNAANLVVGDALPLCSETSAVADQADVVLGWTRGSISLSRLTTSVGSPVVAWAIVLMRTSPAATTAPLQIFNPFLAEDLERQDILGMGHMEVPPLLLKADDTNAINKGSLVEHIHVKVSRKVARNSNNLFLWIVAAGATDDVYASNCSIRSLMKFG